MLNDSRLEERHKKLCSMTSQTSTLKTNTFTEPYHTQRIIEDEEAIKHGCFVMVWPFSRKIFLMPIHHECRNKAEDQG